MKDSNTMGILKAILTDLGIPVSLLHHDTLLYKDLQLDSTEIVEISLGLKHRLGVRVKLESRQDVTLAQICQQVEVALASTNSIT